MNIIQAINHTNDVIAAAIPLALPLVECVIRLVPTQKPLSLFHLAAEFFHGLGNLATTVGNGMDGVVPQNIGAPKA